MNKVIYWSDENHVDRDFVFRAMEKFGHLGSHDLLAAFLHELMPGRIALVSSFGAEAAILLHMASLIDKNVPIIFIDTHKLFPETLAYRDGLAARLGLSNIKTVYPAPVSLAQEDPTGALWQFNPDRCCALRKVAPLEKTLEDFCGWITGRKRIHGRLRQNLPLIELSGGKVKLNPLANWTAKDVDDYFTRHGLPRHPLYEQGYFSIGCMHCTSKPLSADDPRSGRWAGTGKTECGIHTADAENDKTKAD